MSRPLYESWSGRFYVEYDTKSRSFFVKDQQRFEFRVVCSTINTAEITADKLERAHR